jgi:tRNA nucleotidyltransferase (CCA-adding enzyme)
MKTSTREPEPLPGHLADRADLTVRGAARVQRLFAKRLEAVDRRALRRLARAAKRSGIRVYLVGGALRDLLLRRPVRDLDVAVEGNVQVLARRLGGASRSHPAFGTCTVTAGRGVRIDLARTRLERYRRPGALPEVSHAGLAEDLARRDFTINALAAPLGSDGPEGLVDPFGGLDDLRSRRVRVLHDRSFVDDPTRAFRAARTAAELAFRIDPHTTRLIGAAAARGAYERLSAARLRHEVERTLEGSRPGRAVQALGRLGLLTTLADGLRTPRGIGSSLDRVPRVVSRHRQRFPGDPVAGWPIALALLLRSSGTVVVERTLDRLQPPRRTATAVRDGIDALRRLPRQLSRRRPLPSSAIYDACRGRTTEALLSVLTATSSAAVRRALLQYLDSLRDARPDITGRDLLLAGVRPGPAVARGLKAALAVKLDRTAAGRQAQLRAALAAARRS